MFVFILEAGRQIITYMLSQFLTFFLFSCVLKIECAWSLSINTPFKYEYTHLLTQK